LAVRAGLLALCAVPLSLDASEAPTDGTVLIRVRGTVRIAVALWPGGPPEVTERRDVEIGTGSGFVVSADGYIVTNHHVVSEGTFEIVRQGQRARVTVDVQAIEVVFPTDASTAAGRPQRYAASLVGSDEALDLAVLYVSATGLPVAAPGDSDAVSSGELVQALGYPMGDLLEVARSGREEAAPTVTSSPGAVSALRQNDRGELAYLQTTATLNPGVEARIKHGDLGAGRGDAIAVAARHPFHQAMQAELAEIVGHGASGIGLGIATLEVGDVIAQLSMATARR
jgi:S1-C subfamily serine protease